MTLPPFAPGAKPCNMARVGQRSWPKQFPSSSFQANRVSDAPLVTIPALVPSTGAQEPRSTCPSRMAVSKTRRALYTPRARSCTSRKKLKTMGSHPKKVYLFWTRCLALLQASHSGVSSLLYNPINVNPIAEPLVEASSQGACMSVFFLPVCTGQILTKLQHHCWHCFAPSVLLPTRSLTVRSQVTLMIGPP